MEQSELNEMNSLWMVVNPHNPRAHEGKAASETGLKRDCFRCRLLMMEPKSRLNALRRLFR